MRTKTKIDCVLVSVYFSKRSTLLNSVKISLIARLALWLTIFTSDVWNSKFHLYICGLPEPKLSWHGELREYTFLQRILIHFENNNQLATIDARGY